MRERDLLAGATGPETRLVNTKSQIKCVAINEIQSKADFSQQQVHGTALVR